MEIHSFNTQVATDYTIEKAILLHNIYFWCKKNEANNVNVSAGRAYTYNTAAAFAQLFPYMTSRKIAETLRQMEVDGLLHSIQNKGTNRVKSYTLTDKALEYYTTVAEIQKTVSSNIQKSDNGTDEKPTMEHTEFQLCSITDINNSYKQQIEGAAEAAPRPAAKKKEFTPPTREEVRSYCKEQNYNDVDIEHFFNYYEKPETNWRVSKAGRLVKMSNWKLAVKNWHEREQAWTRRRAQNQQPRQGSMWGSENTCGEEYAAIFEDLQKKERN